MVREGVECLSFPQSLAGIQMSVSVIPDILPPPSFPTSSIGNPRPFPIHGRTNERPEEKNPGFPLQPVPDICYRGTGGNDSRGKQGRTISPPSFPTSPLRHSRRPQSGIHGLFPCRAARMKGQKRRTLSETMAKQSGG